MSKRPRRWLQFSMRTLLVAMTLLAIALGWVAYEREQTRQRREGIERLEGLATRSIRSGGSQPAWSECLFGADPLANWDEIYMRFDEFSDEQSEWLKGMSQITGLGLTGTELTDAGLPNIRGLTKLVSLHLAETRVSDAGLIHLRGLANLEYLDLGGTHITDAGLENLYELKHLRRVWIDDTSVTPAGVEKLERALPNTIIYCLQSPATRQKARSYPFMYQLYR